MEPISILMMPISFGGWQPHDIDIRTTLITTRLLPHLTYLANYHGYLRRTSDDDAIST